jgi:SAM-dependent methyltransferase
MRSWGKRRARSYRYWAALLALFGYRAMLREAFRALPEAGSVLDIGCGSGEALGILSRERPRLDGVACDLSIELVRAARGSPAHPAPRGKRTGALAFCVADAEALPFADTALDAALSFGVLGHLLDAGPALAEMARVLRHGGRLALWTRTNGWISRRIASAFERENPGVVFRLHDPRRIASTLALLGMEVLSSRRVAGGTFWLAERSTAASPHRRAGSSSAPATASTAE